MGDDEWPRRRNQRHPMEAGAVIRTPQGMSFDATMEDVSVNGCSLRLSTAELKIGRQVLIRLDGLESLIGVIRWIRSDLAGIEFDKALHVAIAEHLARVNPKVTCSASG